MALKPQLPSSTSCHCLYSTYLESRKLVPWYQISDLKQDTSRWGKHSGDWKGIAVAGGLLTTSIHLPDSPCDLTDTNQAFLCLVDMLKEKSWIYIDSVFMIEKSPTLSFLFPVMDIRAISRRQPLLGVLPSSFMYRVQSAPIPLPLNLPPMHKFKSHPTATLPALKSFPLRLCDPCLVKQACWRNCFSGWHPLVLSHVPGICIVALEDSRNEDKNKGSLILLYTENQDVCINN